jgi:hypothetical protein
MVTSSRSLATSRSASIADTLWFSATQWIEEGWQTFLGEVLSGGAVGLDRVSGSIDRVTGEMTASFGRSAIVTTDTLSLKCKPAQRMF